MNNHFSADHFNKKTIKSLNSKGIFVIGIQAIPDTAGSYLGSTTGYCLNNNGIHQFRAYLEVLALA